MTGETPLIRRMENAMAATGVRVPSSGTANHGLHANKGAGDTPLDVFVSESVLLNGTFGVYGIAGDQPDVQVYLSGAFPSIDAAFERAHAVIARLQGEGMPIPTDYAGRYRKREEFPLQEDYRLLDKDDLVKSVAAHINQWFAKISKRTLLKGLLSSGNLLFFGTILTIWIYWTDRSITVPDVELPIVSNALAGTVLDRRVLASYYPIALFLLLGASFFKMSNTNLANDLLRRKIIVLVKRHSWTLEDFARLIAVSSNKSTNPWFLGLVRWLHSNDLNSLSSLCSLTGGDSKSGDQRESNTRDSSPSELTDQLGLWIKSDFDRRFHNLLYLDKNPGFRPAYMCFDPAIYLIMNNRTIFRLYSYLKAHGYHVHEHIAPTDPYLMERMMSTAFWVGVAVWVALFGTASIWSIAIEHTSVGWTVMGITAVVTALCLATLWNYRAVVGKRGFPSSEPIGAYTVGPFAANRLSVVGW